ncbi:hypothetical protein M422DRAFT_267745 [Sphaerobolus stellatus SS14]|uniref:Unplaced genomic scaffold SPHSTscaffold_181, whole genome shotgun sequence n=1 Tax=Sphaerobolus stellatus (strain SS14) TaxID=990650 RepID=A0A0C9UZV3_SPHS4|nr:hypothetical protein M422DRAFT_267745 [Sphaerobolus stellatus SS14]
MKTHDQLLEHMFMEGYLLDGGNKRVREYMDYQFCNGNTPRNVFHHDGHVHLATRRLKTDNILGQESFVLTMLPSRVSCHFDLYLVLIQPFIITLCHVLSPVFTQHDTAEVSTFLWIRNGRWATYQMLLSYVTQFFKQTCGIENLGCHGYRHMVVEIVRLFLGSEYEVDLENEEDMLADQCGHKKSTSIRHYANELDRINKVTSKNVGRSRMMSKAWFQV